MTGNFDINTLLIILLVVAVLITVFLILGKIFEPFRKVRNGLTSGIKNIGRNINKKLELRRKEIEQKRKEEFEKLKQKREENEYFVSKTKDKIAVLNIIFKELEEVERTSSEIYEEIEEKTTQIDMLSETSYKFIFKLINDWKIKKLVKQCKKQKQRIEESEKKMSFKKEELKGSIVELLNIFNDLSE